MISSSLSLVAWLAACDATTPSEPSEAASDQAEPAVEPSPAPAKATGSKQALEAAIRQALEDVAGHYYFDGSVDLNDDGRAETLALVAGPMLCGSGGCPVLVFTPEGEGFRLVTRLSVVQGPVKVSDERTNGWRDLVVGIGGGGMASGFAALAYDGATYPSNPTVPPARRVDDPRDADVVIPTFDAATDGTRLGG